MNRTFYGKPDTSEVIVDCTKDGMEQPKGFVRMEKDRPGVDYICLDNYDGTGSWILPEISLSENLKRKFVVCKNNARSLGITIYWAIKVHWYCWVAKDGFPIFRSTSIFQNLFLPSDARKRIVFIFALISLLCVNLVNANSHAIVFNTLISMVAAAIFDVIINLIPREDAKKVLAKKIADDLSQISIIKNIQYIAIGYMPNPIQTFQRSLKDVGYTKNKCNKLIECSQKKLNAPLNDLKFSILSKLNIPIYDFSQNSRLIELTKLSTNKELFVWANHYCLEKFEIIKAKLDVSLFPLFYYQIEYATSRLKMIASMRDFSEEEIGRYVEYYFHTIESLELYYRIECYRYVGFQIGYFNYWLNFDKDSIRTLLGKNFTFY